MELDVCASNLCSHTLMLATDICTP